MKCNGILLCLYIFFYVSATGQVTLNFNNSPLTSSYLNNSLQDSDSVLWHYYYAKSGNISQNTPALCLGKSIDSYIISDSLPNGISSLSFFYEQAYSSNCLAYIFVNDSCFDTITSSKTDTTFEYFSPLYSYNPCVIKIQQASHSSGQILIGSVSYTKAWEPEIPLQLCSYSLTDSVLIAVFSDKINSCSITYNSNEHITNFQHSHDSIIIPLHNNMCGNTCFQFSVTNEKHEQLDTSICVVCTKKPELHDIIITEIMCNPNPSIGLAEKEYIELYNRSDCPINLKTVQLAVNESIYELPHIVLESQHHICIYNSSLSEQENSFGILSIPVIRALNNDGATIALLHEHTIISSVTYSKSWYKSAFKENGGWSLEKIDYNNCAETTANWRASQDYSGGTPGYINSVYKSHSEISYPEINSLKLINDTCLYIHVSENCNLNLLSNCTFEDNSIASIHAINYSLQNFYIYFSRPYSAHKAYNLNYSGVVNHNNIPINWNYSFALCDSLLNRNDIIISEILFNPENETDEFIEIYNTSSQFYDLSEIFIARIIDSDYTQIYPLAEKPKLIKPYSYSVISTDSVYWKSVSKCKTSAIFSEIPHLPSFPNTEGNCVILNKWGIVIDSIWYHESMHTPNLLSVKGISLERISNDNQLFSRSNWESANYYGAAFSPGCANSHGDEPRMYVQENNGTTTFSIHSHTSISSIRISTYNCLGVLLSHKTIHPHSSSTKFSWDDIKDNNKKYNQGIYFTHISGVLSNGKPFEHSFRILQN